MAASVALLNALGTALKNQGLANEAGALLNGVIPALTGDLIGNVTGNVTGNLTGNVTFASAARTATADGLTTGTIADAGLIQFVAVTAGGDANSIIVLPTPTPGKIVVLHVGATGYELRTSDPTTIGINGGTGSAAESAIGANVTAVLICASLTSWKGLQLGSDGTLAKVEVAAP